MKLKLTGRLRKHAEANLGVKAGASQDAIRTAVVAALKSGKLTAAKYTELTSDTTAGKGEPTPKKSKPVAPKAADPLKAVKDALPALIRDHMKGMEPPTGGGSPAPSAVISKAAGIRLKTVAEKFERTRKSATYPELSGAPGRQTGHHPLAGRVAVYDGVPLHHPSEFDKALAGAYFKWSVSLSTPVGQTPSRLRMTDVDRDLIQWALHNEQWSGMLRGDDSDSGAIRVSRQKLTEFQIKALLDDSVSGGIEIAPVAFDDAIIVTPVLFGELYPYVNVVNISRGRRMKGGAMSNPNFTSGTAEGTQIQPFNTASFVTAFDTPIYNAVAAIELGNDFEEDSPVAIGTQVVEQYGFKALEWLDRVVAVGDGVTEPLGILNSPGTTVVNSDNGAAGPATVSDYEGLMFGLAKQFRTEPGAVTAYLANDTMYRRSRAIPVGPGDERRVFGMSHSDYMLLDRPYKVQNSIANGRIAFVNLRRYRMYRRLGLQVRTETTGRALALSNTKLIVLRMRFGGQLETGGAAAIMTDAQS